MLLLRLILLKVFLLVLQIIYILIEWLLPNLTIELRVLSILI